VRESRCSLFAFRFSLFAFRRVNKQIETLSCSKLDKTMGDESDHLLDLEAHRVAKEARNLEITLFWQRSNYFLVLSTAIAAGFFSLRDAK